MYYTPHTRRLITVCLIVILTTLSLVTGIWQPAQAAPGAVFYITVDTLTDHAGDYDKYACLNSFPDDCSLRGAIRFANATDAGSKIHISIPANPDPYYIMRPGSGEDLNETGDLDIIERTVFLEGAGRELTILDGQTQDRVIDNHRGVVTVEHLKITQGIAPAGEYGGGGILNRPASTMTLNDVLVEDNSVLGSGEYKDIGGGVSNRGNLTILNSSIMDNAACHGGGVNSYGTSLIVKDTIVSQNLARSDTSCGIGGGIATYGGNLYLNLTQVTVEGNDARYGGGVFCNGNGEDDLISDSIIRDNEAVTGGGGIYNYGTVTLEGVTLSGNTASSTGGGILNMENLTLVNVTISGNNASFGGGLYNFTNTTISLDHCTLANNTADASVSALYTDGDSTLLLHNTILAGGYAVNLCFLHGTSTFNDQGYNLSSDATCSLSPVVHDLISTDPKLGSLGYEGGFTPTMLLLPASPAIDAADPATTQTRDQRGYFRPVNGDAIPGAISDIGAYEYLSFPLSIFSWLPLILK